MAKKSAVEVPEVDPLTLTPSEVGILADLAVRMRNVRKTFGPAKAAEEALFDLITGWSMELDSMVKASMSDVPAPTVTSLTPSGAVLGSPSFTLHVHGTGFGPGCVVVFAGQDEPTTVVSATEVTTGVDMAVWHGPDVLPVLVRRADGLETAAVMFTFTAA